MGLDGHASSDDIERQEGEADNSPLQAVGQGVQTGVKSISSYTLDQYGRLRSRRHAMDGTPEASTIESD